MSAPRQCELKISPHLSIGRIARRRSVVSHYRSLIPTLFGGARFEQPRRLRSSHVEDVGDAECLGWGCDHSLFSGVGIFGMHSVHDRSEDRDALLALANVASEPKPGLEAGNLSRVRALQVNYVESKAKAPMLRRVSPWHGGPNVPPPVPMLFLELEEHLTRGGCAV